MHNIFDPKRSIQRSVCVWLLVRSVFFMSWRLWPPLPLSRCCAERSAQLFVSVSVGVLVSVSNRKGCGVTRSIVTGALLCLETHERPGGGSCTRHRAVAANVNGDTLNDGAGIFQKEQGWVIFACVWTNIEGDPLVWTKSWEQYQSLELISGPVWFS